MCFRQLVKMQNSVYYISSDLIAKISGQEILQKYPNVDIHIDQMKIVGMILEVTTHRLILRSNSSHSFLIKGQIIKEVSILESGFFSKDYFLKLITSFGKIKFSLKNYNEAKIIIQNMTQKKAWLDKGSEQQNPTNSMYTGIFDKISKEKQKISSQANQVDNSFSNFETLFGNLRDLKKVMGDMKVASGQSDGDNPQINKILKDMGFVSVIDKNEAGKDFYVQLAKDLFNACENGLFKNFGGMVSLLDLFYFYNKKRQMSLISPQELLKACELFQKLGLHAKLVRYPGNLILVQSTSFNPDKDFDQNFAKFFPNFREGYTAQQISRKKGLPVAITEIKLKIACKLGKLAFANRIEGVKYYKNYFSTI